LTALLLAKDVDLRKDRAQKTTLAVYLYQI
jgi:hypothetical protein